MQLQLIRNATLRLQYAGRQLLIDPYFAPRHSRPTMAGISPNPTVELPIDIEAILDGVEGVIVSHLHSDHFDTVGQQRTPKALPLWCQPEDEATIKSYGFTAVIPLYATVRWENITITRTKGHHGTGEVEGIMGKVMGFTLAAPREPTVYWAGDTILCSEVSNTIDLVEPDVVIIHASGARWPIANGNRELIVMDAVQAITVCQISAPSKVIATHMAALDHGTVSRQDLRDAATQAEIRPERLLIPQDGEAITIKL